MNYKEFREENDLTQIEFAKIIGIPKSTYQDYEYGIYKPRQETLDKIYSAIKRIEKEKKEDDILCSENSKTKYWLIFIFIWVLLCFMFR